MNAIFYFSGTGNSRHIARSLSSLLGDVAYDMAQAPPPTDGTQYGRLGWVFPVYAWGIPAWVKDYMRAFPAAVAMAGSYVYGVMTCGDDTGMTDKELQSVLREKGMRLDAAFSVQMPNTYVCLPGFDVDPPETVARKLAAARTETERIADDIRQGRRGVWRVRRGVLPRTKSHVLRSLFNRFLLTDRLFHTLPVCDGCRVCALRCPVRNISPDPDGRPRWTGRCTGCLACYHSCPHAAIQFGRFTHGKGHYVYPALRHPASTADRR